LFGFLSFCCLVNLLLLCLLSSMHMPRQWPLAITAKRKSLVPISNYCSCWKKAIQNNLIRKEPILHILLLCEFHSTSSAQVGTLNFTLTTPQCIILWKLTLHSRIGYKHDRIPHFQYGANKILAISMVQHFL